MDVVVDSKIKDDAVLNSKRDIFGSFSIAGMEFALSVDSIQEVINEPDSYSPMPLAPDYLVGLFNLRGVVVPVVDLRKIFDVSEEVNLKNRKVAIIEYGDHCIGLIFDKTGEVFNGDEEEKSEFNSRSDDAKESVVKGVFKLGEDKRIVQILDAMGLLNLDFIPRSENSSQSRLRKKMGKREQCISFVVGNAQCALSIDSIQEIINVENVDNIALSGELCLGVVSVRENSIPIIDFSKLLGYGKSKIEKDQCSDQKIIIMKVDDELFGLVVSSIENIISYFKDELISFPVLGKDKKAMFIGCISSEGQLETILLNHEEILSNSEIESITRGHSNLYKVSSDMIEEKLKQSAKKTYIMFSVKSKYALEISEVNEVLDIPDEIIEPPNLSSHFSGMINLRGDLVPIIDLRNLYGMEKLDSSDAVKILIFSIDSVKYGMIVDSVDSIVTFCENSKVKLPELMYKKAGSSISDDVKEAVQIETIDQKTQSLLILNLQSLSSRVRMEKIA